MVPKFILTEVKCILCWKKWPPFIFAVVSDSWVVRGKVLIHQQKVFQFSPSVEIPRIPRAVWVHTFLYSPPAQKELKHCAFHHSKMTFLLFFPQKTGFQPKSVAAVGFLSPSCDKILRGAGMLLLAHRVSAPRRQWVQHKTN